MKIAQVQFAPWDKAYDFSLNGLEISLNDQVVVKTELGHEIGRVINLIEVDDKLVVNPDKADSQSDKKVNGKQTDMESEADKEISDEQESKREKRVVKPILRKAEEQDFANLPDKQEKERALKYAISSKDRLNLSMKIFDVHFSFDKSRITFAFIADGRIDFRDLVKDLTRHFGRQIRLHQIGIRDEAKIMGDVGHCGRILCCKQHLKDLVSITSEMSELQQCAHRGSERISGCCGRLMCCLAYEQAGYEFLDKRLPEVGRRVNVDGKRGQVVNHQVLKQVVNVLLDREKANGEEGGQVIEVDMKKRGKK